MTNRIQSQEEFIEKVATAIEMGREYSAVLKQIAVYIEDHETHWRGEEKVEFLASLKTVRESIPGPHTTPGWGAKAKLED